MRAVPGDSHRWTPRQWFLSILGVLAFQVAVIWIAGEPTVPSPAPPQNEMALHLAADPWSAKQLENWPGLEDPTVFALPSMRGFSGKAWLTFEPMNYELKGWTEPPAFLQLGQVALAQPFLEMVSTNHASPLLIADKPMPTASFAEFAGYRVPMPTQSWCRITGPLAKRKLEQMQPLPAWPNTDLLTNSIVELFVNAEGFPISARLEVPSGLREADQYALELARQIKFETVNGPLLAADPAKDFTWGKLIFQWHVVPPPNTNQPGAIP